MDSTTGLLTAGAWHTRTHNSLSLRRRRVAALRVAVPQPGGPRIITGLTVSIGVALHPVHGSDPTTLLTVADTALHQAKRAGRNAVRMAAHG